MTRLAAFVCLFLIGTVGFAQSEEVTLTTLEEIQVMENALRRPENLLPFQEEWDAILEDARNSGNRELELRARSAVAALAARQRRSLPVEAGAYLEEAWRRETERRRADIAQGAVHVGSAVSLGLFAVGTAVASGSLVLGDQFWREFVTAPRGSVQARNAYARMAVADYASVFGSLTAIIGAVGFVAFELFRDS